MSKEIYWLNKESRLFLSRDYLLPGVTPEQRIRQIAEAAEKILEIKGFADKFESYLKKGWYSLSSPVWSNFGLVRGLPISCNGSYISDSMSSILGKSAEVGMLSKHGAGTSGYFGELRPRGAEIKDNGQSSGPVHFMQIFETQLDVISQGSIRRGSFAAYLPVEHPDIEEFLEIRSEGNAIQKLSIGVTIGDEWMKSLIAGDKKKRDLWAKIIKKRFETGYPYLFFKDNINKNKPQVYKDKNKEIFASNLCVAPETLILTKDGHRVISGLEGREVEVWNGKQWSSTRVVKTGTNQSLLKVKLSDGKELSCTKYHKWYTVKSYNDQRRGKFVVKTTEELCEGDQLIKFEAPIIDGEEVFLYPYAHGAFCGDGTYENGDKPRITLYGEKKEIAPFLDQRYTRELDSEGRQSVVLPLDLPRKFKVPLNSSVKTKISWLEGYFDMDGTIARNGTNESIQAVSVNPVFLREIQQLLQTLGVNSKIILAFEEGYRIMPDHKGGEKEYFCQKAERILISSVGLFQLARLGFSPRRLKFKIREPQREAAHFVRVLSITDELRKDDTYCVNEPIEHKAVFNGILTGNCSEICLPSSEEESFVCNLSSMNLLHFEEWKDTDAVETMIYFLDAVMSEYIEKTKNIRFMEAAHRFAKNHRALGLGTLGWHSLLQSRMISFESMEAKLLNTKVHKLIYERALKASKELAVRYGQPDILKYKPEEDNWWGHFKAALGLKTGYGMRNTTVMAIAPTTSSSHILGQVSQGIEPLNSNYYVKDLAKSKSTYKNPYLEELLKKHDKNDEATWKSILVHGGSVQHLKFLSDEEKAVFKTFGEISQKEIVIQAAARQKYIDQSQSLNLMIAPKAPPKEVSDLLIFGWEQGVKTFYYQRSANPAQLLSRSILTCASCEG